jgi:hypothetical protein
MLNQFQEAIRRSQLHTLTPQTAPTATAADESEVMQFVKICKLEMDENNGVTP